MTLRGTQQAQYESNFKFRYSHYIFATHLQLYWFVNPEKFYGPPLHPQRRSVTPKITEAYCVSCGRFLAASPRPELLYIAEQVHTCPPGHLDIDNALKYGQCRITKYLK